MIRISSENRLKYLGRGHVSAQNYSISKKFICLGVHRDDKTYVKLRTYSHAKQILYRYFAHNDGKMTNRDYDRDLLTSGKTCY